MRFRFFLMFSLATATRVILCRIECINQSPGLDFPRPSPPWGEALAIPDHFHGAGANQWCGNYLRIIFTIGVAFPSPINDFPISDLRW